MPLEKLIELEKLAHNAYLESSWPNIWIDTIVEDAILL